MKKHINWLLAILMFGTLEAFSQENRSNEVTVEFFVACDTNGELDAEKGTVITMEVTNNEGEVTKLTYTFPKGSHARAITKYFADALRSKKFEVEGPQHNDLQRKSKFKIKNVKSVKAGTSLNGKLPITFSAPPPPPTRRPDTLPPPVKTGILPRQPKPTDPPTPSTAKPHRGPTTLPPRGPASIQILVTFGDVSGGKKDKDKKKKITISISASQGAENIVIKEEFPKDATATEIVKVFHAKLVAAGFDLKPYEQGDTQIFFNKVYKIDGAYSHLGARTTFGWGGEVPVVIDDKGRLYKHYSIAAHYDASLPTMEALNDYFDWINSTWNGNIAHLNTLQGGSIEGAYMFNRHFGMGAGYRMLTGSTSGTTSIGGNFNTEINTQGGYLLALGKWSPGSGRFSVGGECSLGYYTVRYTESEEQRKDTYRDESPEIRAEIRLGYQLTDHIGIVAGVGYQGLKFDDFGLNWLSPGKPPAVLDLSGPGLRAGLEFRF